MSTLPLTGRTRPLNINRPRPSGIPRAVSSSATTALRRCSITPALDKLLVQSQLAAFRQSGRYPRPPLANRRFNGPANGAESRTQTYDLVRAASTPTTTIRRQPDRSVATPRPRKMILVTDENDPSEGIDPFLAQRRRRPAGQLTRTATAPAYRPPHPNHRRSASFQQVSVQRPPGSEGPPPKSHLMVMKTLQLPEVKPLSIKTENKRKGVIMVPNGTTTTTTDDNNPANIRLAELSALPTQILMHTPPVSALKSSSHPSSSSAAPPPRMPACPELKYIWTMMDEVRMVRNGGHVPASAAPLIAPNHYIVPLFKRHYTGVPLSPSPPHPPSPTTLRPNAGTPTSFRQSISRLMGIPVRRMHHHEGADTPSPAGSAHTPTPRQSPMLPSELQEAHMRGMRTPVDAGISPRRFDRRVDNPASAPTSASAGSSPHWVIVDAPPPVPRHPSATVRSGGGLFKALMRSSSR